MWVCKRRSRPVCQPYWWLYSNKLLYLSVNAGGPDASARTSDVDACICPASEGCGTSASPSSYMLTVHLDDDDVTPLFSLLLVAAVTAKIVMVLIVVFPRLVCTVTHRVTMTTTSWRTSSKQSLAVWVSARTRAMMRMGNVSVGVDVGAVVGVGIDDQCVSLGVGLGVGLIVGLPLSLPSTLREPV